MPALGTEAAMEDRFVRLQRRLEDLHYFEPLAMDAVPLVSISGLVDSSVRRICCRAAVNA
jgi:hypothetical protein